MMHPRAAQRGFTLLEVLITLTLMAVLSLLSWRALDTTARSSEHLQASADATLALLRVLGQVESDLAGHAGDTALPEGTFRPGGAMSSSERPAPDASVLPPGIRWQPPRLTIVRAAQDGRWQEVVWQLESDRLVRAAGLPAIALPLPEAREGETLLAGVHAFTVRAWVPGQGWSPTTAPGTAVRARGLEIALALAGTGETFRKVVVLP